MESDPLAALDTIQHRQPELVEKCRDKLIEVAAAHQIIEYGQLAAFLGVHNLDVGQIVSAVFRELPEGAPDITLLVVYKGKKYGNYEARGRASKYKFDENDPAAARRESFRSASPHAFLGASLSFLNATTVPTPHNLRPALVKSCEKRSRPTKCIAQETT